ncbi:serine/threonine-protein kinase Nek8-like [Anopheles albimanus]|uniref:non-specific serine/threonine protein kinase n=1 Tax=Anopheles albimanus TaxID=7167 RepID=A0A182FGS5_ANOAL|nr:serine/threonine-protein kinase Nek8-like [Anopheles albimanus]
MELKEIRPAIGVPRDVNQSGSTASLTVTSRFEGLTLSEPPAVEKQGSSGEPEQRNHLEITGYRWLRIVGQGSFGVAILYERQSDGQQVVMKQVALGELTDSEREMAMNEVEVFSKLHHPNIIAYLGSRVHGDRLFIEMEYADGGTLAQMLAQRAAGESLPERFVLNIFEQLVSAIAYMHSQSILHRDLKTANVFLHRKGTVKVGDFGISKITSTKVHAQTVLGTPYYFSPEMCEGKTYDEKSDIWALGCILGEMCCLKKAFTAANLSELVSKIMSAEYVPLSDSYSPSLRQTLALLFKIDPIARPSATELLQHWLPIVYRNLDSIERKPQPTASATNDKYAPTKASSTAPSISRQRTVLYQLHSFGQSSSLAPLPLPPTLKIRQIATRGHHFVAVMEEGTVYSWGEGDKGQLGHDALESWHHIPMRIEAVRQHSVIGAAVGQGFTLLWTQTGALLSCGDNSLGCLGHGNRTSLLVPQQVAKLERFVIVQVSCGTTHVLALTEAGIVYSWGTSTFGALALGKRLHTALEPERVLLPQTVQNVRELHAGPDCTILITREADCYCCGSNAGNRLGLGRKVASTATLRKITIARGHPKILAVSVAETHAAFLVEGGYLVTLGDNRFGQRGLEHRSELLQATIVRQLESRYILSVRCSDTYTVAITEDNCVVLWGTRMGTPDTAADGANIGNSLRSGHTKLKQHGDDSLAAYANSTAALTEILTTIYKQETIFTPSDVLALYSSKEQQQLGSYVKLLDVHPLQHSLLVLIETNCPMV